MTCLQHVHSICTTAATVYVHSSCAVFCRCCLHWLALQTVEELLQAAGCTGAERVAAPSWHYAADAEAAPTAAPAADGTLALRDALAYCYDLRSPKAEPLLQLLQAAVGASKVATAAAAAANGVRTSIEVVANATAVAGNGALLPPLSPADTSPAADAAKQQQAQPPAKAAAAVAAAGGGKEGRGSARSLRQQLDQLSSSKEALVEYLAPRHVADVLREFGCTQLAPQQVSGAPQQRQSACGISSWGAVTGQALQLGLCTWYIATATTWHGLQGESLGHGTLLYG